jgi:diacylglycerol kinase (ATP)
MDKATKKGQADLQTLAEAQTRQAKRLKKVEEAWARFEKQQQKLRAVEAELAVLARRALEAMVSTADLSVGDQRKVRRTSVIVNPKAKALADGTVRLAEIVEALRAVNIMAEVGLKTSGKVARQLARQAVKRGDPLVIVAAGDGTVVDVAGELVGSHTSLGILPLGTMNNLAHVLGVPLDLRAACQLLAIGVTRPIDMVRMVTPEHPKAVYFLETAGVGLSALAAGLGQDWEKGRLVSLFGTLTQFFTAKTAHVTLVCDDAAPFEMETNMLTISNSPFIAQQLMLAPAAKMDDGWLDLALYEGMNKIDLERYFLDLSDGKPVNEPRVRVRRVRTVQITADEPLAANAGMDILPERRTWTFDVAPRALSVIVGKGCALMRPFESAPLALTLADPPATPAESAG